MKKKLQLSKNSVLNRDKSHLNRFGFVSDTDQKPSLISRLIDKELHKHPFAVPVFTFMILAFLSMVGFVLLNSRTSNSTPSHVVQLSVDSKQMTIPTRATTVGELISRSKVKLKEGDVVEPSLNTEIDVDDFRINVYRAKPVTILDGGKRIQALSAATTPRAIAAQAGVQVHAEDRITQASPRDVLRNQVLGTELIIERATPVHMNLYGTAVALRTHAKTVGELLKEKNVSLAGSDEIMPSAETPITASTQVFITRKGTKIETITEEVPNEHQVVEDNSLSFGTVAVRQAGSPGKKLVTYQIDLANSQETGRRIIQEVRILEPVPKITARGKAVSIPADKSAWMASAGIASSDYPYVNYIISRESGWCPTKWQGQIGYCPPYYEPIHSTSSGYGYGLCQSTPAGKMASAGADWQTNAVTQLKWCSGYAKGRYGSWEAAYNFWSSRHWW